MAAKKQKKKLSSKSWNVSEAGTETERKGKVMRACRDGRGGGAEEEKAARKGETQIEEPEVETVL